MRDHELDVFGRVPAAASTAAGGGSIPNGRGPFSPPAHQPQQPPPGTQYTAAQSAAAADPPSRSLSALSTATAWSSSSVASSSVASMEESAVSAAASASTAAPASALRSANGGASGPSFAFGGSGIFGGNGSSSGVSNGAASTGTGGSNKRPLASLNPNFNPASSGASSSGADATMDCRAVQEIGGGGDSSSSMMTEEDFGGGTGIGARAAVSPWSSSALRATTAPVPHGTYASSSHSISNSNKRVRPTPTMSAIRHRLASKLVSAVQKTSHTDSARPYTTIVECLDGEERRVCSLPASASSAAEASSAVSYSMSPNALPPPYRLFFTPEQALTRAGWEVREVHSGSGNSNHTGGEHKTTTTLVWTLYGNAASEWIQAALEGHGSGQQQPQPRQPYHVHPVPYDGPVRVGYGGRRQRMYAYAGIEALEAKLEIATNGNMGGMGGMGTNDGILTLTVRTYLAGLVDEAKVTFSPWG